MAERFLSVVLRASNRKLKADLRRSHREIKSFATSTRSLMSTAFAAGVGGFAGAFSVAGLANFGKEVINNEELLTRIGIQANLSKEQMDSLRRTAVETGQSFGLSTGQVLQAANAIINLEGAAGFSEEKMRVLAQASVATGAELSDLAGVAFALRSSFKISEADDLAKALSAVTAAGKQGSIPLNEMSTVLQQISADFKEVSGAGVDGAADLAAALQVARTGFGSAAETGTGLKAFVQQLSQNADKFRGLRARVTRVGKDGTERLRPLREILDEIDKSGILNRKRKLNAVFGSAEAQKFLKLMVENRAEFERLSESARKANDVQADSQRFLNSEAGRLKIAIARARSQIESLFTPERIEKFVDLVSNQLVPALDFVVEHARAIGIAVAAWKLGPAAANAGRFALLLGKGTQEAGGLMSVFGKMGGATGGILASLMRFGPLLGAAGLAVWGIVEAYQAATKENEKLTEEVIRRAEIEGRVIGKRSQFDPLGIADARRRRAAELRAQVRQSNALIFDDRFDELMRGSRGLVARAEATQGRGGAQLPFGAAELDEIEALRQKFIANEGVLSQEEGERFQALLDKTGIAGKLGGEFLGGAKGVEALREAAQEEATAEAMLAVRKARFGRRDFRPEGFDVRAAAQAAGLSDPAQIADFERTVLEELRKKDRTLGPTLGLGPEGLRVGGQELAVNEQGQVVRRELEQRTGLGGLVTTAARAASAVASGRFDESLTKRLDELNENLRALAERPIRVELDGQEVGRSLANNIGTRRSPR